MPQPPDGEPGSRLVDRPAAKQAKEGAENLSVEMGRGVQVEIAKGIARGLRSAGSQERLDQSRGVDDSGPHLRLIAA